jgi:TonB family protein
MNTAMNLEAIRSDWVGRVIDGRFTLIRWLGGTERSSVFLTELPGPQARKAAIKLIPDNGEDAEFHMAGWAATRPLSHPNLMRLILTGRCQSEDTAVLYAVSEYADEVLSEILPERMLTPVEAQEMLEPVIDALFYLHGKGLVHGHLKPSNVLVVDDRLKLSGDSLQLTGERAKGDSAYGIYDAPETAGGTISPAADVWGLGVTLVEALTQHPPVWDKSANEDPIVPQSIPQPFAGIARGCLRADPVGRCTLDNVKSWLEAAQALKEETVKAEKNAESRSRLPILLPAAIVMVVTIGILIARHGQQATPAAAPTAAVTQQQTPASAQPSAQGQTPEQPAAAQPEETSPAPAADPSTQEQPPSTAPAQQSSPAAAPKVAAPVSEVPAEGAANGPAANSAVAEQVMPNVLPRALESIQGKVNVRVRVTVDGAGNVSGATFDSEGPSKYFAKAAMQAAQNWKFKPAQAAPGAWVLQFEFTRDGAKVTPVAVH